MSSSRSIDEDVTRLFNENLRKCTIHMRCEACGQSCGRPYIQTESFTRWLRSRAPKTSSKIYADLLLAAAFRKSPMQMINVEQLTGSQCCLVVFSILFQFGRGDLIPLFIRRKIGDGKLPIPLLELKEILQDERRQASDRGSQSHLRDMGDTDIAEAFNKRQWAFCAATFDDQSSHDHGKDDVVPICRKTLITDKGGTAVLWRVAAQEEFVGQKLRDLSKRTRFKDPDFGWVRDLLMQECCGHDNANRL